MAEHLWVRHDPKRYFLVPEGITLPSGELALRTPRGRSLRTTEEGVQPYEVPAERGAAIEAQIRAEIAEQGRELLGRLQGWQHLAHDLVAVARDVADGRAPRDRAAQARVGEALGVSLQQYRVSHDVTGDVTLMTIFALGEAVAALLEGSEEGRARAAAGMVELTGRLSPSTSAPLSDEERDALLRRWDRDADAWTGLADALRGRAPEPPAEAGTAWRAALVERAEGLFRSPAQAGPDLQATLTQIATSLSGLLVSDPSASAAAELRLEAIATSLEERRPDSAEAIRALLARARSLKDRSR